MSQLKGLQRLSPTNAELTQTIRETVMNKSQVTSSVNAAKRRTTLMDAKPLLVAHKTCRQIWKDLRGADYKNLGYLDDVAIGLLFDRQSRNLGELLQVGSAEELQLLIDEDTDGYWNEDEQILLFSVIKERMQNVANDLCDIFEYNKYKKMMEGIRSLEADILKYQDFLRKKSCGDELQTYKEIGEQKVAKFNAAWEVKFKKFEEKARNKIDALEELHAKELEDYNEKLTEDIAFSRVKPVTKMKDLQTEEKLLAVSERVGEASKIHKELVKLEASEQNRVVNKILSDQQTKVRNMQNRHKKEIRQAQNRNEAEYNKMRIQMDTDYQVLQKEINLHFHDIKKAQNLSSRLAQKAGKTHDELRRTKWRSKIMMSIIEGSKGCGRSSSKRRGMSATDVDSINMTAKMTNNSYRRTQTAVGTPQTLLSPRKTDTTRVTKFHIKHGGVFRPVNLPPDTSNLGSSGARAQKILGGKTEKLTALPALTSFYSTKLELLNNTIT